MCHRHVVQGQMLPFSDIDVVDERLASKSTCQIWRIVKFCTQSPQGGQDSGLLETGALPDRSVGSEPSAEFRILHL